MDELVEWLDRIATAAADQGTNNWVQISKRLCSPSLTVLDDSIVRIADAGMAVTPFGRLPAHLEVLQWMDRSGAATEEPHNQALAAQLGALLTFSSNRRIQVAAADIGMKYPPGSETTTFIPADHIIEPSLGGPVPDDLKLRFETHLRALWGLAVEDRRAIGSALELNYAAVLLFDVDANAAYALCVAGIETLSREYGSPPHDWSSWDEADHMDAVFEQMELREEQSAKLREELLMNRHLRLRQTFASYVVETIPNDFWSQSIETFHAGLQATGGGGVDFVEMLPGNPLAVDRLVPRDATALRRRLLASYDARSSYVHEGGHANLMSRSLIEMVADEALSRGPISLMALRFILVTLISAELTRRSTPRTLPKLKIQAPQMDEGGLQSSSSTDDSRTARRREP